MAELAFDTSDLNLYGSDLTLDEMDFVFTEYTFSLNMNKIYKETFDLCMDTGACAGKLFNSEEKIQTRMYEVIWTNTTASYDENKDM